MRCSSAAHISGRNLAATSRSICIHWDGSGNSSGLSGTGPGTWALGVLRCWIFVAVFAVGGDVSSTTLLISRGRDHYPPIPRYLLPRPCSAQVLLRTRRHGTSSRVSLSFSAVPPGSDQEADTRSWIGCFAFLRWRRRSAQPRRCVHGMSGCNRPGTSHARDGILDHVPSAVPCLAHDALVSAVEVFAPVSTSNRLHLP